MKPRPDAVVVGGGVSGLTTAICLAEDGLRVTLVSADPPARTTSAIASALVGPNLSSPEDPQRAWSAETMRVLSSEPMPGVAVRTGHLTARPAGAAPPYVEQTPGYRLLGHDELPDGFGTGFQVQLPLVDMPVYLDYLRERLLATGATVEHRAITSLAEATAIAPRVAHCSGLAARHLAGDTTMYAVRGPKIVVDNPGLESFFLEAPMTPVWASIFPHGDHVVLGGSQRRSEDTTPDEQEAADIIRRCVEIRPELAGCTVREHVVGLRPGRDTPRVEAEHRDGGLVVHNYGHAGNGVMLSWGCARDAAALLTGSTSPT
jgi:D-amino-acid oxidase